MPDVADGAACAEQEAMAAPTTSPAATAIHPRPCVPFTAIGPLSCDSLLIGSSVAASWNVFHC